MKNLTFTFIDNASHGYLKISNYDLKAFNIDPKQFSNFSFYNCSNGCLYLEEDCDALLFFNALEAQGHGAFEEHTIEYVYKVRSPVRGYEDYAPE